MSTFEIARYAQEVLPLVLEEEFGDQDESWMGHIGKDGNLMLNSAIEWARKSGVSGNVEEAFERFFTYARKAYLFEDQDSVCITLRKAVSGEDFKVPRPHHDGCYWDEEINAGRLPFKVGTVLCGPSTLFWETSGLDKEVARKAQLLISTEMDERARELDLTAEDVEIRKWAVERLGKMGVPIVLLKKGECVRWVVGDGERAGIHSEPDMSHMPEGRLL